MPDFRKFQKYRVDLSEIYAFYVSESSNRSSGYHDKIVLYPKTGRREVIEIYYYTGKDEKLFNEAVAMLDEYFDVKTEAETRILP